MKAEEAVNDESLPVEERIAAYMNINPEKGMNFPFNGKQISDVKKTIDKHNFEPGVGLTQAVRNAAYELGLLPRYSSCYRS